MEGCWFGATLGSLGLGWQVHGQVDLAYSLGMGDWHITTYHNVPQNLQELALSQGLCGSLNVLAGGPWRYDREAAAKAEDVRWLRGW